jgi:hypothetical protein
MELVPVFPSLSAVMVTGPPALTALTSPFASTAAAALFDVHVTVRPVSTLPPASLVTAVSCCVAPTVRVADAGLTETVLTGGGGVGLTVIELVPAFPSLVAVIASGPPAPTAVTRPLAFTVATEGAPELHVILRPVRTLLLASLRVAVSC